MNQPGDVFEPVWAAGFMSGTSIDAVDAALILTDGEQVFEFGAVAEYKYTGDERDILKRATEAARRWNWRGDPPSDIFEDARRIINRTHEAAWEALMDAWQGPMPAIAGVHGQTVLHRAPEAGETGRTLQLLDAADLRRRLGVRLAYDFRTRDVEQGGQGAPLAPAYHAALLSGRQNRKATAVLNLGGVANITCQGEGGLIAFDTGPANGPIDEWIERHGGGTHDVDGRLARAGEVDEDAVQRWMAHPWFRRSPPKSLDRFDFNAGLAEGLSLENGAATLTAFSAEAVAHAVRQIPAELQELIICGGGRRNPVLLEELRTRVPARIIPAEEAGWRGDSIEAEAFALLAVRTLRGLPISWPGTTSVPEAMPGGRLTD